MPELLATWYKMPFVARCDGRRHIPEGTRMLVLTRKEGERILIGANISVTVVRILGGGVRLGVEAPPEVPVMRSELKEKLDAVGEEDASSRGPT